MTSLKDQFKTGMELEEENLGALIDEIEGKVDNETITPIQQTLVDIGNKTSALEEFMGDQGPMNETHSTDISNLQAEIVTIKSQIEGLNTRLQALEEPQS